MANFDRDSRGPKKFGNRDGGNRRFDGGPAHRSFSAGGPRDGGRPMLHQATCSKCGKDCMLPFRPSPGREVFCSNCFGEQSGGNDRRGPMGNNFKKFDKSSAGMHSAICAKCGTRCEVPFRPIEGKPVYCKNCFDKGGNPGAKTVEQNKDQFAMLNAKLDKILQMLNSGAPAPTKTEKKVLEVMPEVQKIKKTSLKTKTVAKKSASKKKS